MSSTPFSHSLISPRLQVVAALAALHHGEGASSLLALLSEEEQKRSQEALQPVLVLSPEERSQQITEQLRALAALDARGILSEIHPGWIVEVLREESPRMIGLLLRTLPSRQARYVLDHLSADIKTALPSLVESFNVPQALLDLIRRRFESRFVTTAESGQEGGAQPPSWETLPQLSCEAIQTLIQDIGTDELAIALQGMSKRAVHFLLNRLPLKWAKPLQRRIRASKLPSEGLQREARYSLVGLETGVVEPNQFFTKVGLTALAKAVGPNAPALWVKALEQKLDPQSARLLHRAVGQLPEQGSEAHLAERRQLVAERIQSLRSEHEQ